MQSAVTTLCPASLTFTLPYIHTNKHKHLLTGLVTIKLVSSTGEQASGILVAAAAPVTLLTALSKSSLGKQVQDSLNDKLPALQAEAEALKQRHAGACVLWLGGWLVV